MLVSRLLKNKATEAVTTTAFEAAIDVVRLMRRERVGVAVVVGDDGKILGTVSERDIVYLLADEGEQALKRQVGQLVNRPLLWCRPADDIKHVMSMMTNHRVRHLPVIEDDHLRGIVSIGDVLKSRLDENQLEIAVLRDVARVAVTRVAMA